MNPAVSKTASENQSDEAGNKNVNEKENEAQFLLEKQAQAKASPNEALVESKCGEADGLGATKTKVKKQKWKRQARTLGKTSGKAEGVKSLKRPSGEISWVSPDEKKKRISNKSQTFMYSTEANCKRELEILQNKDMEMAAINTVELTTEAGCQPHRQP